MDPVTHTLVGASLAATRLRDRTRGAVAALVVGANLPDVDVLSYVLGSDTALGFRRGWTHGILALAVLPALLALALRLWAAGSARSRASRPVSGPWLLLLSYLAVWTHPCLDWLNTYGMRWLAPFRDTWFYGDSVFIVDPWLWLALGCGWLLGRKPTRALVGTGAVGGAVLMSLTAMTRPAYIPVVIFVFLGLAAATLYWSKSFSPHKIALRALTVAAIYVGAMLALHAATESRVEQELARAGVEPRELMVGPRPANPLAWEFVARVDDHYRHGRLRWPSAALDLAPRELPAAESRPEWDEIRRASQAPGFRRWARFPWLQLEPSPSGRRVYIMDARYARQRTLGFGGTQVELPPAAEPRR